MLLVVRERYENLGTHISPYLNLGLSSDEVITLLPNLLTPEGLAAYLSMFGVGLNEVQAVNLFLRTQQRFTGIQAFLEHFLEHGTVDLGLLANDSRDLESDISELSGDEILAVQMIASLPSETPTMVSLRIVFAWASLLQEGLVESDASIFDTLAHRDVLQFYSEPALCLQRKRSMMPTSSEYQVTSETFGILLRHPQTFLTQKPSTSVSP